MSDRHPLTHKFLMGRLREAMGEEEKDRLEALVRETGRLDDGAFICRRFEECDRSTILLDGFAARVINQEGERHIVAVQVPGDFIDLHSFALRRLDHDLVAIGPARVGYVQYDELARTVREAPHLTRILWFSTLLDAAIHREWILKMEQLDAARRLAHLFSELWCRLHYVGLTRENGYSLPFTQVDLANMCGTTAIHMNRTVQRLRSEEIVDFRRGEVTIPDLERLHDFAKFTPDYLYGEGKLLPLDHYLPVEQF